MNNLYVLADKFDKLVLAIKYFRLSVHPYEIDGRGLVIKSDKVKVQKHSPPLV